MRKQKRGQLCVSFLRWWCWWGAYLFIRMLKEQRKNSIPSVLGKPARVTFRQGVWETVGSQAPLGASAPAPLARGSVGHTVIGLAWGTCGRVGVRGGPPAAPPAGRERFLQSLLSAKGARRRPRERSSAGASGGLLPAGSGKADAVWSSTRQTATTSHNFILKSRPAAAPRIGSPQTPGWTLTPGAPSPSQETHPG